jgi:hypothetical protein
MHNKNNKNSNIGACETENMDYDAVAGNFSLMIMVFFSKNSIFFK